jgi:hypothetical protein
MLARPRSGGQAFWRRSGCGDEVLKSGVYASSKGVFQLLSDIKEATI